MYTLPHGMKGRLPVPQPLSELVHPGWLPALEPQADRIADIGRFLRSEVRAGRGYFPAGDQVLRAFSQDPAGVKVVIVGQDPYPTPGHAVGLSFSVAEDVRPLPRSLQNIFREYCQDLDFPMPSSGDLAPWSHQGVLLLNRVLTVQPGKPGSHRNQGWEEVTSAAIAGVVAQKRPLVAVLWGRDARSTANALGHAQRIESSHPSPMSADRGFFGSQPFSRANELLVASGADAVDWRLP